MMSEYMKEKKECKDVKLTGTNDGSKNDFYKFPDWVKDVDTLSEYWNLDFYDGNVLKTLTLNLGARHEGTSKKRELNKRLHYSKMAIEKFQRQTSMKSV